MEIAEKRQILFEYQDDVALLTKKSLGPWESANADFCCARAEIIAGCSGKYNKMQISLNFQST